MSLNESPTPVSSNDVITDKERLDFIKAFNIQEIIEAFNLDRLWFGQRFVNAAVGQISSSFSKSILEFDRILGRDGQTIAGRYLLDQHSKELIISGAENVPLNGPVVFICNHPGLTDTVALFSSLPRHDLRILARDRKLLTMLPEVTSRLILLSDDKKVQFKAMQNAVKHLKHGGAIMTFPAGQIEPDPHIFPTEAIASIRGWSASLSMFANLSSKPTFVPIIVSGVFSPQALNSWLTGLRQTSAEKEWLAAFLQVLWPPYRNVIVNVKYGRPIPAEELKSLPDNEQLLDHIQKNVVSLVASETESA